jgi:multidrug efflux system outer membrane protein
MSGALRLGRSRIPLAARLIATGLCVGLGSSGCSFAPSPEIPGPVAAIPDSFSTAEGHGAYAPVRWWETFGDPTLNAVVDSALVANLDLREAIARVEEFRNRYRIAGADLFPSIGLNAGVTRQSSPANTGIGGQITGGGDAETTGGTPPDTTGGFSFFGDRFAFTTYSASLDFAYEIDFWGRARNDRSAAVREFLATRADLETARLAVIGAVISTYFEVLALRDEVELSAENVDLLRERAELTDERYQRGLVSSFELYSVRQLYRNAESRLPGLRTLLFDAEGRLAVLVGRYAGEFTVDGEPTLDGSPIPAYLPAALLAARPDVMAAGERMEAARHRVGARRAELLPTLSLNGSVGLQASEPRDLFNADQYFLNLLGNLFAPLFQGGRLRANIGAAEAQYQQLAAAYARTVLTAFREVQTALRGFENERQRYASVQAQLADAQASVEYQLRRYQRGVGDYVSYLDARTSLVTARTTMVNARRALAEARLTVHRALGGAWVEDVEGERSAAGPVDPSEAGVSGPPESTNQQTRREEYRWAR